MKNESSKKPGKVVAGREGGACPARTSARDSLENPFGARTCSDVLPTSVRCQRLVDFCSPMSLRLARVLGLLCLVVSLVACGDSGTSQSYEQRVMQDRVQRDMQMREKNSVVAPSLRSDFRGLNYYPVDTSHRYVVPLQRYDAPDTVRVAESTGTVSEQVVVGTVAIPFPQKTTPLVVFKVRSGSERGKLWIPFADSTNGASTYTAGRYVDLQPHGGDSVVVDFNRAYNPTCAYDPNFACPLPPPENRLALGIPAGEKKPSFR